MYENAEQIYGRLFQMGMSLDTPDELKGQARLQEIEVLKAMAESIQTAIDDQGAGIETAIKDLE